MCASIALFIIAVDNHFVAHKVAVSICAALQFYWLLLLAWLFTLALGNFNKDLHAHIIAISCPGSFISAILKETLDKVLGKGS